MSFVWRARCHESNWCCVFYGAKEMKNSFHVTFQEWRKLAHLCGQFILKFMSDMREPALPAGKLDLERNIGKINKEDRKGGDDVRKPIKIYPPTIHCVLGPWENKNVRLFPKSSLKPLARSCMKMARKGKEGKRRWRWAIKLKEQQDLWVQNFIGS